MKNYFLAALAVVLVLSFFWFLNTHMFTGMITEHKEYTDYVNESVSESNETYPVHPKLSDCEKLKTGKQNFCFDDVAELTNNINICEMIGDPDVKIFCIARVSLNEIMCRDVIDTGLREACLESIEMKRERSRGR